MDAKGKHQFSWANANSKGRRIMIPLLVLFGYVTTVMAGAFASNVEDSCQIEIISEPDLRIAMVEERALGYDATATTNTARYFAGVIFRLARSIGLEETGSRSFKIRYDDWFSTFLAVHGLSEEEAPLYLRLAYEHRQDVYVGYDSERVIKRVKTGRAPLLALDVQLSWPEAPDLPDKYSFLDTLSNPTLQVTNHRILRYRLLDFGDMISYDQIEGISGRPASGILGALFKIIGEGKVVWSRMAVSSDSLHVIRAKSKKLFVSVTTTVSVLPNGAADKGVPEGRPDLTAIETVLSEDLEFEYGDWNHLDGVVASCDTEAIR